MSTALFTGVIQATNDANGLPILLVGVTDLGEILAINDEGRFIACGMEQVTLDWRYNWKDHTWVDVNEVFDAEKDDAPDGGEAIPGPIPGPDFLSPGDSINPEGRQAPGDPGDVDTREDQQ